MVEDMREKAFMMGNREMINLLEQGDDWRNHPLGPPYQPKQEKFFTYTKTQDTVILSLPFSVMTEGEMFYAGLYEASAGSNLLSIHVIEDETHEEVAISY